MEQLSAIELDGVTFHGNKCLANGARGGAVMANATTFDAKFCTFTENSISVIYGGALCVEFVSNATITDSSFVGNSGGRGGAMYAKGSGPLTIDRSVFSNNTGYEGAGALLTSPTVSISNCLISGNSALGDGGGLSAGGPAGSKVSLTNTVVAFNQAKFDAGGVFLLRNGLGSGSYPNPPIRYEFVNCTILGNSSGNAIGGVGGDAGGTVLYFSGTALANNTGPHNMDLTRDTIIYGSNNLFGALNLAYNSFHVSASANQYGTTTAPLDPKLGPLTDNGGPMLTMAPLPGSPLLDAGINSLALATDQRGLPRNVNLAAYPNVSDGTDIGAVEIQSMAAPTVLPIIINGGAVQRSRVTSIEIPLSGLVALPSDPASAFQLTRQSDGATIGLNVSHDPALPKVTLTFTGSLVEAGSLPDGRYTLTVLASQVLGYGGLLDGNGDGASGDDFVLVGNLTNKLFRLFGDSDGDGTVSQGDFGAFRNAMNTNSAVFDVDGDGNVGQSDFMEFRNRFGVVI